MFKRKLSLIPAAKQDNSINDDKQTLKLQRRAGEKIIIEVDGEIIEVIIGEIVNLSTTRIVVKASKRVKVDREEIYLKKQLNPTLKP
jgi:sRNA-binding carbon storage regulator CsrA